MRNYEMIIEKDDGKFYLRRQEEFGLRHWYTIELREGDSITVENGELKVSLPSWQKEINEAVKNGSQL